MLNKSFLSDSARDHSLSPEQEEVFLLKILENISYDDIASRLGISKASCLKRMGEVYKKFEILGSGRGKDQRLRKLLLESSNQAQDSSQLFQPAFALEKSMTSWFNCLGYEVQKKHTLQSHFEWILKVKARRGFDRIVVHGIDGEAQVFHLNTLRERIQHYQADEGWVVAPRRVSQITRIEVDKPENKNLFCYTFDELIDEEVNFDNYFNWLEQTIQEKDIQKKYVDLACRKEEYDPSTKEVIHYSHYGKEEGWVDGYIDRWLDDPAKEHISILGEFGTGKTWFTLHYAWVALQRYKQAKERGLARPRIPLLIPLREFAKAVNVKSIFLEFLFDGRKVVVPDYSVFEQLNHMGKLLLIFDGFDEMAAKIDHQSMVNNFWELAKVVVPSSKAILTCRTEHFPDAQQGRALLNAQLEASTSALTIESQQFEVLELKEFDEEQIYQILLNTTTHENTNIFMRYSELLNLARRPLMVELILEALDYIQSGEHIDLAKIYLHAMSRKMDRDIDSERTFTSLADKLYFLCEVSWEMLSKGKLSLSYKEFPGHISGLFGDTVKTKTDLDHWHYDMMGQTILIRDEYGQYTPAHKSFLEFFTAYKFTAELGCLANDFVEVAQRQSNINSLKDPIPYRWSTFFQRKRKPSGEVAEISPLQNFNQESIPSLEKTLGLKRLTKTIIDFMVPMLGSPKEKIMHADSLVNTLLSLKRQTLDDGKYLTGNIISLLLKIKPSALKGHDLSNMVIWGADFTGARLQNVDFTDSDLTGCIFPQEWGGDLSVIFSPNGKYVAIASSTGTISLWDVTKEKQVWQRKGHHDWIRSIAFNAKGDILASGSHDKTIKLWDVSTGELKSELNHKSRVYSIAFSKNLDSHILASAGDEDVVKLWDTRIPDRCLQELEGHRKWIGVVTFGLDQDGNEILASGSDDHTIRLWNPHSGKFIQELKGHRKGIDSISFDVAEKKLASGSADKTIKLWDIKTNKCIQTLTDHEDGVRSVNFSLDGKLLASGGDDKTIRLWNIKSGQCIKIIGEHKTRVWSVAFSPDKTMLASGSDDKFVKIWDLQSGQCLKTFGGNSSGILSLALAASRHTVYVGSDDHYIYGCNTDEQQSQRFSKKEHTSRVRSIALYEKSNLLISGSDDKSIKLWDSETGQCLTTLASHHEDWIWSVAISPDGQTLASGSLDTTVMIWDLSQRKYVRTLSEHSDFVWSVAWHPTDSLLASGSADKTVKLWNPYTGECLNTLSDHKSQVTSVAFSPTGHCLASGSDDETIRLWDPKTGECQAVLQEQAPHNLGQLSSIAFSPDGKLLAIGGLDSVIRVWDINTEKCVLKITDHIAPVLSLTFSPDGQRLVSGGEAGVILLSDLKTGTTVNELKLDSPYDGMKITNVHGLDEEQKSALEALGAVC